MVSMQNTTTQQEFAEFIKFARTQMASARTAANMTLWFVRVQKLEQAYARFLASQGGK